MSDRTHECINIYGIFVFLNYDLVEALVLNMLSWTLGVDQLEDCLHDVQATYR